MSAAVLFLDKLIALGWITTYTLVLISTVLYKYPTISPITQLIIAPFEFSFLYSLIVHGQFGLNYSSISYLYWSLIEVAIIIAIYKTGAFRRRQFIPYCIALFAISVLMIYLVAYRDHTLFFSYFNTFIGEVFWLLHIIGKNYPVKPLIPAIFVIKLVADILAIPVYVNSGSAAISVLCIALPILDLVFVSVYLEKKTMVTKRQR